MLRKIGIVAALLAMATVSSGCMSLASPAFGLIYTDVQWDGDAEGAIGAKEGKACANSLLGIISTGDASIKAAAQNGGITKVTRVDHYTRWVVLFGEYCTIVGGT